MSQRPSAVQFAPPSGEGRPRTNLAPVLTKTFCLEHRSTHLARVDARLVTLVDRQRETPCSASAGQTFRLDDTLVAFG